MLQTLITVIDRLIQLVSYRSTQKKQRFGELFEPVYLDLAAVQGDYVKMFEKTLTFVPEPLFKVELHERELAMRLEIGPSDVQKEHLRQAAEYLRERREEFEPLRIKLRALAAKMSEMTLGPEERRFVEAVVQYFPSGPGGILDHGGSPSRCLLGKLLAAQSGTPLARRLDRDFVESFRSIRGYGDGLHQPYEDIRFFVFMLTDAHKRHWAQVSEAYAALKIAVVERS